MANRKVSLLWSCRTPKGWRRFPILKAKNGRVRMGYVNEGGVEQSYPQGHFELRHYEGRRTVFTPVGTESDIALIARIRLEKLQAKAAMERLTEG